jgi:AraC family transcriptional activator of pobA
MLLEHISKKQPRRITIPTTEGLQFILLDDIIYLEASDNYTNIYLAAQKKFLVSRTLKTFEDILPSESFLRIHHGTIVNKLYVEKYIRGDGGQVVLRNGIMLDISKRKKVEFLQAIGQLNKYSNPQIPYSWEHLDKIRSGVYCVFNQEFFQQFGNLSQYEVFQPGGNHIFELTDEQVERVNAIFRRIFEEINSDYIHKYDALRPMVFELIHLALKTQPSAMLERHHINASQRIVSMFLELLERQFPLDDTHQCIQFRSASDFAKQLNVHVNHLNRAIKEITEKTTSQIIAERILQEAKILLKRSEWNVSDISYALGFKEITHFNNFFKKHVQLSPLKFRNV